MRGSGRREVGGTKPTYQGDSQAGALAMTCPGRQRAVKGKAKVGDSEVIRKKLNERSSFRKGRQRAEH